MTKLELERLIIDFVIDKGLKIEFCEHETTTAYQRDENNVLTVEFHYKENTNDRPHVLQSVG